MAYDKMGRWIPDQSTTPNPYEDPNNPTMYAGGSKWFDEGTGQYTGGPNYKPQPDWTDIAMGPQPEDKPWTSFNNMMNNPTAPQYNGPTTGQKGWPATDPKSNPWNTAKAAMQARTQANKDAGLFRVMGDLVGGKGDMINPLGMKPWQAAAAPTTVPTPAAPVNVAPAAAQLPARTAPVADVPVVAPPRPAPTFTPQPVVSAPQPNMSTGTLYNMVANPAQYANNFTMNTAMAGLKNMRGKIM